MTNTGGNYIAREGRIIDRIVGKSYLDNIPESIIPEETKNFWVQSIIGNKDFLARLGNNPKKRMNSEMIRNWYFKELQKNSYEGNKDFKKKYCEDETNKPKDFSQDHKNQEVIFKNIEKIIVGYFLRDFYQRFSDEKKVTIFNVSDFDRVVGKADYVMAFTEDDGKRSHVAVNVSLDNDSRKNNYGSNSKCIEFINACNLGYYDLERMDLSLNNEVIYSLIKEEMDNILKGKPLDNGTTYEAFEKAIKKQYQNQSGKAMAEVGNIRQKINSLIS